MKDLELKADDRVLLLGGTGFVGRRLLRALAGKRLRLRLMARDPMKVPPSEEGLDMEVVKGDVLKGEGLHEALNGIHSAFYLVHSMGGRTLSVNREFIEKDRRAARNFIEAANASGLKRVVYLGGLGELGPGLSEHLRSRAEVAAILSGGLPLATILRAAVIIGAGGASFEMLRHLVERLPVMICPRWVNTRIQPIAIRDVIAYLQGCLLNPATAGRKFDICGPEVLTYKDMMRLYAEARGLAPRLIITVPVLTTQLASYWVDLVTPVPSGIAHPLIEGLKNEVVCQDNAIDSLVPITKTPFIDAVRIAYSEETGGPGVTGF